MKFKVGLIGCGRVGALLEEDPLRRKPASHMGGIHKINHKISSISICDINEERLSHCKTEWGIQQAYIDYKDLLLKERPEIVVIATWTDTHRAIALEAVKQGVRGIVLEKPVATDLLSARKIIDACRRGNVKLVVNHERRWDPLYKKTQAIVEEGSLGTLKAIYGNVLSQSAPRGNWEDILPRIGGGPLLHDGTHLADMIRYFCGDIDSINGSVKRENREYATETTATAMMRTLSGVDVFIEAGGMREYFNFELDLHFQKGRVKIGNGIREYYTSETSTRYTGFRDLARKDFPKLTRDSDPFSGAILEVMNAIETDSEPKSSGVDGLKAMEIIFGIYHSARLGGRTVRFPLKFRGHPLKTMFRKGIL